MFCMLQSDSALKVLSASSEWGAREQTVNLIKCLKADFIDRDIGMRIKFATTKMPAVD